ncbi:MAG TPA: DUF3592 domain-containing protein [Fimbriimonadaceae bacterium]|nr:DUF3592 domain-containing protein [Fimbriimonadaceae bacterium]
MDDSGNYGTIKVDQSNAGCVGFVAFLILAAFGVWLIVSYLGERRLLADLDVHGLRQQGVVVDHVLSTQNRYYLEVRYDAAPKLKDFRVSEDAFSQKKNGDAVTVRYMSDDPYKAKLEGLSVPTQPAYTMGIAIGLIALGTAILAGLVAFGRKAPVSDF